MQIQTTLMLTALLCLTTVPRAESRTYFKEAFTQYGVSAPICNPDVGIKLGNDPIWTQTADASCAAEAGGWFFREFQPATPPGLKAYDFLFSFRFNDAEAKHVRAVLRLAQDDKVSECRIDLEGGRVSVAVPGFAPAVRAGAALTTPLPRGVWIDCVVSVRGDQMLIWLSDLRQFKPVLEVKVPAHTLAGINFDVVVGSPFSLTNIELRDPAPLPDNSVSRLLPAPRRLDESAFSHGGEHAVPVADRCGATLRVGAGKETATLALDWSDGTQTLATFGTAGVRGKRREIRDGKMEMVDVDLPDAFIQVAGLTDARGGIKVHVRPLLRRYHTSYSHTDDYHDIVRDWETLPSASAHPLRVEARRTATGTVIDFDGSLAADFSGRTLTGMVFSLTPDAALSGVFSRKADYDAQRYLPLDIAALGMARSFVDARSSLKPGPAAVKGIPMIVADGAGSGDVGLARQGQGNWALEVDEYTARSPFDGLLTELHFAVPGGVPYTRAWVLCAVDPDPEKDPVLTTRLAYYVENGSGNNRIADTVLNVPRGDEKPGEGIVQVGTVEAAGRQVPLLLVEVPLHGGRILDLMMNESRLNFEFIGKPWENFEQIDNSSKPDPRSTSAVQIFGVTLEKGRVGLAIEQAQPANVFHNEEKPEMTAVLNAFGPAKGRLAWDIVDIADVRVGGGGVPFQFAKAGDARRVVIPLQTAELGWYGLNMRIEDEAGRTVLEHPAAFARLGHDTRKAHLDSPFGVWWFDGSHGTPSDLDFAGPVMEKAGIRTVAWTGKKAADLARYRLFKDQVNMPFKFGDFGTTDEMAVEAANPGARTAAVYAKKKEAFDKTLLDNPHLREVLIFHESGPGNDVPPEVLGLKHEPTGDRLRHEKRYADLVNLAGPFLRTHYPQLKTVLGNNSCSAANVAAVLRHGGNPDYIDFIGIEAPSQVFIPEKLQEWALQGLHIAMDTAEALCGRRIPATGCYEFTYRCERDMGELQHAEWYARDVLISLANRFTRIGPGILFDVQNAYYNGLWGASGLLRRGPTGYPKPAYVAYAVLTDVMDQATFSRQIPTGSTTVYAVEFQRADGRMVTALWAARGTVDFAVDFGAEVEAEVVELFGRRQTIQTQGGTLTVRAGTSPAYLLTRRPAVSIAIEGRRFPKDDARAQAAVVVAVLEDADELALMADTSLDTPLAFPVMLPVRKAGAFDLATVQDDERGRCVELTLQTDRTPDLNKYFTEYAVIKLKEPAVVAGAPVGFGVWVKGNSNWGRVLFEIEDANGETWRSIGTGGWGCDILDWPGNAAVNFDGWNFVSLPLSDTPLFNDRSPGPVLEQWVSGGGDKVVDFPVKVTGLIVEMNRRPLELLGFADATPSIRIQAVGALMAP